MLTFGKHQELIKVYKEVGSSNSEHTPTSRFSQTILLQACPPRQ